MAIEDFEWEGDVELTRPSQARLAAAREAAGEVAATRAGLFERLRKSVWLEPALRLVGMGMLLAVLAGIGVVATTYAKPGLQLPAGSRALADALGTSWLKPSAPPSSGPSASAAAAAGVAANGAVSAGASAVSGAVAAAATLGAPQPAGQGVAEPNAPAADAGPGGAPAGVTADGKVVLNQASADELTKLPGVGPKRAQAIVALRTKLKRFKHPTDLLRVKGIGPKSLQRMLPHLVLDA